MVLIVMYFLEGKAKSLSTAPTGGRRRAAGQSNDDLSSTSPRKVMYIASCRLI